MDGIKRSKKKQPSQRDKNYGVKKYFLPSPDSRSRKNLSKYFGVIFENKIIFRRTVKWIFFGSVILSIILMMVFWYRYNNFNVGDRAKIIAPNNLDENKKDIDKSSQYYTVTKTDIFHINIDTDQFKVNNDVIEGSKDADLHKGIIHQSGSAFPSVHGGNVIITGHSWYPGNGEFSKIFFNLDKLKIGDKITVKYKNKEYVYVVEKRSIVMTADEKLLANTKESYLTLYTCYPKYTSDKRLVYTAKLKIVR